MIKASNAYEAQAERVQAMFSGVVIPANAEKLPDQPFISITETLTWLAFGVPLETWAFNTADQFGIGPFGKRDTFLAAMKDALSQFVEKAAGGELCVRGRYVSHYSDHGSAANAETRILTPEELRDFARFDSLYGGLERGDGFTWEETSLTDILAAKRDGWRAVEVQRASLLRQLAHSRSTCADQSIGRPNQSDEAIRLHLERVASGKAVNNKAAEARAIAAILDERHRFDSEPWSLKSDSIARAIRDYLKSAKSQSDA